MIKWKEITLEDKTWMEQRLGEENRRGCEYSFANNYIWSTVYHVQTAETAGCGVIKFDEEGTACCSFPFGAGDKKKAMEALLEQAEESGAKLHLESVLEEDREFLEQNFRGRFVIEEDRNGYDYIYATERLTKLAGKKLHGKRNHIARFKDNDNWTYEAMTKENKQECYDMNLQWCDRRACKWNQDMSDEQCALHRAIQHFEELELEGGVLRVDGKIVAFTIGERLCDDTYVVHFEKAFPDIQGAYPMINQQFVEHNCQEFLYVNREDDTGDEGLRKAKLSYYPDILLPQYTAVESDSYSICLADDL